MSQFKFLGDYEKLIVKWPSILSLLFLLLRFIYILVKSVRIRLGHWQDVSANANAAAAVCWVDQGRKWLKLTLLATPLVALFVILHSMP